MGKGKDTKGITADKDDFSEWFTQMMMKADLADYSDVSGAIVFKPASYAIWEKIVAETDKRFKKLGVKNAYFPLFIPEKFLMQEAEHVEGFAPEVAWVEKAGNTKLGERLAVRPTSEAIMYPSYSKWIRSWRDLPLKINQWNNVVRWEFKHPVPFLRTREFLWNELHTALATEKEALEEGKGIIDAYRDVCENYMALYGVYGRKTDKEKFAGAVFSEKLHYVMPNGKTIEGSCFHHDGQNFAKAYDISFLDENEKKQFVYQNTYAISTRMLGVMFAVHSDEKGLVLPPKVAPNQVVVVPILIKGKEKKVLEEAEKIGKSLEEFGAFVDAREDYKPGFKFNEWELKGIPLRIEIGPKDLEKKEAVIVRRDNGDKQSIKLSQLKKKVPEILGKIQMNLFEKSKEMWESRVVEVENKEDLVGAIRDKKIAVVPLKAGDEIEEELRAETGGAKTLFVAGKKLKKGAKCVISGEDADYWIYVAKSY